MELATLFVAAHAQALAIDALVHAIPHSVLIAHPFSDEVLIAKIEQAICRLSLVDAGLVIAPKMGA